MRALAIIGGPNTNALFENFRHQHPIALEIKNIGRVDVKLTSLEFEDGSGVSFNLQGYVHTEATDLPRRLEVVYYHSGHQKGTIRIEEPALAPA